MTTSTSPELTVFAEDVRRGLCSRPKTLSSKYFYDDEGSRLFQEIMKLPEYYLTGCEHEIFSTQADAIYDRFVNGGGSGFDLIELGAGDGTKTAVLVDHFLAQNADISYSPIDISQEALDALTSRFSAEFPSLKLKPLIGDYFRILESLKAGERRKVLLFLGSNIGNFSRTQALEFFRHLRGVMNSDDQLFIGFDLQKDPHVIVRAYDDEAGVTAAFNLNLLTRINRELGGNFDLDKFTHYAIYRPVQASARSFLISREKQSVYIKALDRSFEFDQWEAVFMEISQKYSLRMIEELAAESGFIVKENFFDSKRYYCDSLWQPAP
jgi:dimethylhistidine N-methyltransferase